MKLRSGIVNNLLVRVRFMYSNIVILFTYISEASIREIISYFKQFWKSQL